MDTQAKRARASARGRVGEADGEMGADLVDCFGEALARYVLASNCESKPHTRSIRESQYAWQRMAR